MLTWRGAAMACLLLAGAAAGCSKEVKVTFINTTQQTLPLQVTTPDEGSLRLGELGPMAKIRHKFTFDPDFLPSTIRWRAGQYYGQIPVTRETDDKLYQYIDPTGPIGPIDSDTQVDRTRRVETPDMIVEQYEVVE